LKIRQLDPLPSKIVYPEDQITSFGVDLDEHIELNRDRCQREANRLEATRQERLKNL
jgi:hypothetical protein